VLLKAKKEISVHCENNTTPSVFYFKLFDVDSNGLAAPQTPANADLLDFEMPISRKIEATQARGCCCYHHRPQWQATFGKRGFPTVPQPLLRRISQIHIPKSDGRKEKRHEVRTEGRKEGRQVGRKVATEGRKEGCYRR
jgi:hypothetical protein